MEFDRINGSVVAPQGFLCSGVSCGIKSDSFKRDLSLIFSVTNAVAAGVFTTNVVKAPCVILNKATIKNPFARAIVVNSGNANACNGPDGPADAARMVEAVSKKLIIPAKTVFCASTGIIGHKLPIQKVEKGITQAVETLQRHSPADAMLGIMTTDTVKKEIAIEFMLDDVTVRMGAMAKGAGMIEPNMATMLAFITTDVAIDKKLLQSMLSRVVTRTFNAITVDGDTSTNDMCLILANGMAKNPKIVNPESEQAILFEKALTFVCEYLAKSIVSDGEGATKLIEVQVRNCLEPMKVAKTIANSPLVKTAMFGNDPNWGRILAAAGRSGLVFDPISIDITLAGIKVYHQGQPTDFDAAEVSALLDSDEVKIIVDFHQEQGGSCKAWTCDFSYDYVRINADYHT